MRNKNAIQHVKAVSSKLEESINSLNSALDTVERPENKQKIENTLSAVNSALDSVNNTISSYQES